MKGYYFVFFAFLVSFSNCTDSKYKAEIDQYRIEYKQKFDASSHAPLKGEQLQDMRFFPSNKEFKVQAKFTRNPEPISFEIPTSSGKMKTFQKYGEASFEINGTSQVLEIYQNLKTISMPQYRKSLFLPFTDNTNGESTYGGGRYIDLKIDDIIENTLTIDFNKSYNPYCAYSAGYNCPIPPEANHLNLEISAGEKLYAGEYIGEKH